MKQTAVEWLESNIGYWEKGKDMYKEFFDKAKEMEKKQINNAFHQDRDSLSHYEDGSAFEEYYNETFNEK
jgi:hypothetical protein